MKALDQCVIYTIGQGQRSVLQLSNALQSRGLRYLFDVRRIPHSVLAPEFSRLALSEFLSSKGIVYVSSGADLGGGPADHPDFYKDVAGSIDCKRLMYSPHFDASIKRLVLSVRTDRSIALFCTEGEPERCHRSIAIGRALETRGIRVIHVDSEDCEITQAVAMGRLDQYFPTVHGNKTGYPTTATSPAAELMLAPPPTASERRP